MTTATLNSKPSLTAREGNINEVWKFSLITIVWMMVIFGAVWLTSWLVGALVPYLITTANPKNAVAGQIADAVRMLTPIAGLLVFIPLNATYMVLAERRVLALFTVRKGPNRVGPDGFLQTLADAFKLLFKENIDPDGCDTVMFTLAPIIFFAPSVFGALPLLAAITSDHSLFSITGLPTGIFYVLAMSSIPVIGVVMGGWASNNKYSLVGGLRSAAQVISYEIPLVLAVISICMLVGSLNVSDIAWLQNPVALHQLTPGVDQKAVNLQNHWDQLHVDSPIVREIRSLNGGVSVLGNMGLLNWNIFGGDMVSSYLTLLSAGKLSGLAAVGKGIVAFCLVLCSWLLCGLYMLGACAEVNRVPFDLPEAESELVSGYNTEYSGIRFATFFLAEFTNLFIVASIAVIIWFGAGSSPFPAFMYEPVLSGLGFVAEKVNAIFPDKQLAILDAVTFSGIFWAMLKVYFIVFFAILVRGTLPRFRIDQLTEFGWKRLIPLALFLLLAVTFLKELI
jgi:NADH-quinone oxidoreductase subunit H